MRCVLWGLVLTAVITAPGAAQRRFRVGPTLSSLRLEDLNGTAHSFTSFGGSVALITSDDDETGVTVARYNDLSTDSHARSLTLFALDSYYYPVGPSGLAPFASLEIGLARVAESQGACLLLCQDTVATTSAIALGFGLGLRVNAGRDVLALLEGRFFQVPNSAIQALELRATVAAALGSPRASQLLAGTVGPALGYWIPVSGPLSARGPFVGARFRRDTKTASSLGLQVDVAPFRVSDPCTPPGCEPTAILFAPGYEASARSGWGRVYAEVGPLLAGFYSQGPDRGIAQGLHGGIGCDLYSGRAMWTVSGRLLWFQRQTRDNVFGVQLGVSLAPALRP